MVIAPEMNAFVVLQYMNEDIWVEGRLRHFGLNKDNVRIYGVMTGGRTIDICDAPPWRLLHLHHQPSEANDTLEWRLTREAVARAMLTPRREELT